MIKSSRLPAALCVLGALALASSASAISFDYSSNLGATINFTGNGAFSFTTGPDSFRVTTGTATGLQGDISGNFTIGAPSGSSAPLTGTGIFSIYNGGGVNDFSATVNWNFISQNGAGGGLNTLTASVNLTNIVYGGTNADLLAFKNDGTGVNTLTFQFTSVKTVQDLINGGLSNSFSGTVASIAAPSRVPDSGTTVMLFGAVLAGLAFIRRKVSA